jgi:hypothetical protein
MHQNLQFGPAGFKPAPLTGPLFYFLHLYLNHGVLSMVKHRNPKEFVGYMFSGNRERREAVRGKMRIAGFPGA